jgi:hypothetical protein
LHSGALTYPGRVSERPRSRRTLVAGAITVAVMLLIAAIFLIKMSPWNDPHPPFHKRVGHSHSKHR